LALWSFSPTVLAYAHLITPDVATASLGLAAAYSFRKWIRRPRWTGALFAGIALGLAELTKTTWIVLIPLWPVLWLVTRRWVVQPSVVRCWRREAVQLGLMMLVAIWFLNLGYGFQGSFQPLGRYHFRSEALAGPEGIERASTPNRFAGGLAGRLPVPLPENYLLGIDHIKWEYEQKYWSYLRGEWRHGGWWYYYLYAMVIKEPLGTWALVLLAAAAAAFCRREYVAPWQDELLLLVPMVVVLVLVSSQTGFNHHLRYVVPAFPFAFILISRLGRAVELGHKRLAVAGGIALGWSVVSSLLVFPHSMSYFNELAGGPRKGHWHLGNSNADWGQDLLYLKEWYDAHPEARPLHVAYDLPLIDPRLIGIEWLPVPAGPDIAERSQGAMPAMPDKRGPLPGWYAVSVNWLHDREQRYDYFRELEPAAWVGYTLPVYHITTEQANVLRRRYGLPELPADARSGPRGRRVFEATTDGRAP
jgi:hypothetical protein